MKEYLDLGTKLVNKTYEEELDFSYFMKQKMVVPFREQISFEGLKVEVTHRGFIIGDNEAQFAYTNPDEDRIVHVSRYSGRFERCEARF